VAKVKSTARPNFATAGLAAFRFAQTYFSLETASRRAVAVSGTTCQVLHPVAGLQSYKIPVAAKSSSAKKIGRHGSVVRHRMRCLTENRPCDPCELVGDVTGNHV
jgi:hypothetical protein